MIFSTLPPTPNPWSAFWLDHLMHVHVPVSGIIPVAMSIGSSEPWHEPPWHRRLFPQPEHLTCRKAGSEGDKENRQTFMTTVITSPFMKPYGSPVFTTSTWSIQNKFLLNNSYESPQPPLSHTHTHTHTHKITVISGQLCKVFFTFSHVILL